MLSAAAHENPAVHPPPPRTLTFGFWGTWQDRESRIRPEQAWAAVFERFGSGGADPAADRLLRQALDSRRGRHYCDSLPVQQIRTKTALKAAVARAGDPRRQCR